MELDMPDSGLYRASSCTLCEEKMPRTHRKDFIAASPSAPEHFDGPVIAGSAESWQTGRILGSGAFATVRIARGLRTGRIVGSDDVPMRLS